MVENDPLNIQNGYPWNSNKLRRSDPENISTVRGCKVILDSDLAAIYGVPTKVLKQAIKRNSERFPSDFVFILTDDEKKEVVTNCDHLSKLKFSPVLPAAFTEHGAIMAAMVLNNSRAVQMSVLVVRAFVRMRETLAATDTMARRLAEIEKALLAHDVALRDLYQKIRPLLLPPPEKPHRQIGFGVRERRVQYKMRAKKGSCR